MSDDLAIHLSDVGKMYRVFTSRTERALDAFGAGRLISRLGRPQPREFWALRGVDLTLRRGERLGVIGRNGAGKTTMLKLITQNVAPTEGTVEVKGQVQALLTAGAGFHPEFTGHENVRAALMYQGLHGPEVGDAIADIAEFTELGDFLEQPFRTYSAGMQARLAFATATVVRPETLIIDEMLSAGDAYFLGKSTERIRALVDGGASVLLVSHSPDQILMFCEETVWLDRGRIVERGPSLEVIKAYEQFTRTIEERRIRARNERLRSGLTPPRDRDQNETLVLRLAVSGEEASVDVRELAVLEDGLPLETLRVGGAQDADERHGSYVGLEGSDWSSPQVQNGDAWRALAAAAGHQPAVGSASFRVYALSSDKAYEAQLSYRAQGAGRAVLEVWRNEVLVTETELATGDDGWRTERVSLRPTMHVGAGVARGRADGERARASRWPGEGSLRIEDVMLTGPDGSERGIFQRGDEMTLHVSVHPRQPGSFEAVPVAVLYRADGIRVSSHVGDRVALEFDGEASRQLRLAFSPLNLGRGQYVFSVALYRTLSQAGGSEPYDLVDRSYEFEVHDDDPLRDGIFEHPASWQVA
jgi:lipopolysaccharide transport system ATP-binding protein